MTIETVNINQIKPVFVINGDNIEVLKTYPDNYFDAVVTDPPYGLGKEPDAAELMKDWIEHGYHEIKGSGFMGKEWDAFVPQPLFWKQVFRVLKHGGHVVSFFGTRTYDWGVMAMRFAGFEVRDCIQWIYGSGFPKSHNIGKAIDKRGGNNHLTQEVGDKLKEARQSRNITKTQADEMFCNGTTNYMWFEGRSDGIRLPDDESFEKICNEWEELKPYQDLIKSANREVIGQYDGDMGGLGGERLGQPNGNITIAATDNAKNWEGWGSALKPANEPIVLARKPLEKGLSIAENVLKYGTGGINIDGCRVGNENNLYGNGVKKNKGEQHIGRFPANLILTHHTECECKGLKVVKGSIAIRENSGGNTFGGNNKKPPTNNLGYADENGEETIEDWNCHPDCPIRIMDEQSGILKSGQLKSESYTKERVETNQGRFPANIILTHHPECEFKGFKKVKSDAHHTTKYNGNETLYKGGWKDGEDFGNKLADENGKETIEDWDCHEDCPIKIMDEQSGVLKSGDMNGEYHGFGKGGKTNSISYGDKGGASRFFYVAKASKSERNRGLEDFEEKVMKGRDEGQDERSATYKPRPTPIANIHPTVKPVKLMQYLVRLITPPNGKVLDPFCGSGTTGIACKLEGFEFVGIEQDPEYTKIAEARIKNWIEEMETPTFINEKKEKKIIQKNLF